MGKLNVLVIGAGSIGCRHIENLLGLGVNVSVFRYRNELTKKITDQYGVRIFESLDQAFDVKQDAVVIANRTDQHIEAALLGAKKGGHLFIEKPLSHNLKDIEKLREVVISHNLVVEIGCMMRFHPHIKLVRQLLRDGAIGTPYLVNSCVGQYLPEWRPGMDYRDSYSSKKAYGGGVLLDLIHELDLLYWWFGEVVDVTAFLDHISDLKIETEDVAQILLRFKGGAVAQLQMDYVSPVYRRKCELVGSEGVIVWDYRAGKVTLQKKNKSKPHTFFVPATFTRNSMFTDHMRHFIDAIKNGGKPAVSLDEGINVLKVALAARQSSINREAVRPSAL